MKNMSREEIDLREKISHEIEAALPKDFAHAIGVIRKDIWHGRGCPCSKCQRFAIKSCADACYYNRKMERAELKRLLSALAHEDDHTMYYCGYCRDGENEWQAGDMLYDTENEICVTPCCHTEATEALKCYCEYEACEANDDSIALQDRLSYVGSQR
jgi:hypothetical protein